MCTAFNRFFNYFAYFLGVDETGSFITSLKLMVTLTYTNA